MRMQLSHQAAERLGQRELVIITERVDDVAFLSLVSWSRWACQRCWSTIARARGRNGGSVGEGRR